MAGHFKINEKSKTIHFIVIFYIVSIEINNIQILVLFCNFWIFIIHLLTASMAFIMFKLIILWVDFYKVSYLELLVSTGMNFSALYFGHEVLKGPFPFAWKPYSQGHGERLSMNLWATFL